MKNKKIKKDSQGSVEQFEQQLADLQKEKDDLFEKLQRLSADYANYQKRAPKQIADSIAYEKESLIKSLLPILDNFEHTLSSSTADGDSEVLLKGVQIIYDQMFDIMKSKGVEQIVALDEEFDPALHQAMISQFDPEKEEGVVLNDFQKGYKLNGRVIRPSRVVVNKAPAEPEATPDEQSEDVTEDTSGDE